MQLFEERNRDRMKSAVGVAAFHALLGYALIKGLAYRAAEQASENPKIFNVALDPPPPPEAEPPRVEPSPAKPKPKDPEGAASPKNLRDTPSPIVALPPVVVLPVPTPVVVAPVAGEGTRPSAGASDVPGPGTGSGGTGNGLGSGESGTGTGGGGGGGTGTGLRWIRGSIRHSDYPEAAIEAHASGTVYMRFVVTPDGRATDCTVTRSSGNAALDGTTCRLIERRFRYRPARDHQGRPVAHPVEGRHDWELGPEPPTIDVEPTIPD